MKKNGKTHVLLGGLAFVMMSGFSQAAELSLDVRKSAGSELRDGEKIATGRIICREAHTGFYIRMNGREDESRLGHWLDGVEFTELALSPTCDTKVWVRDASGMADAEGRGVMIGKATKAQASYSLRELAGAKDLIHKRSDDGKDVLVSTDIVKAGSSVTARLALTSGHKGLPTMIDTYEYKVEGGLWKD